MQPYYIKCGRQAYLPTDAEEFIVEDGECSDAEITKLNLTKFTSLKRISIGANAYSSVTSLMLTGLTNLQNITIGNECFNSVSTFETTGFNNLLNLTIGDYCFANVDVLKIEGLDKLERVTIGRNSFTRTNAYGNPTPLFSLKNCPMLKEVQIGTNSFYHYLYSYVENLASLESIVFGSVDEDSNNFYNVREATFQSDGVKGE